MADAKKSEAKTFHEFLWKVIGRFDTYIGSTNTKAALIDTFDTFVLGTIVFKWAEFFNFFTAAHPKLAAWAGIFVTIAAVVTLASLAFVFLAINPFLFSPKRPTEYHSNIFFEHIKEHATPDSYLQAVTGTDDAGITRDLALQAHALSKGISGKFGHLKRAVLMVIVALAAIVGLIVCMVIKSLS